MRILGMVISACMAGGLAYAATVDLNDGRTVQGDIVKQDAKSLEISVDGITMTYYTDEIKDIDGKPFVRGSAPSLPAASAAAQPESQPAVSGPAPSLVGSAPAANPSTAGIDPEKRVLILKFIDVFGTRQALINNFETMLKQIEKDKPDEALKIRQRIKIDEIIEHLLPIYDRNFTAEDLKAFIAFYGSEEGQKLINTIPELMKESVEESVKYMQEKFPEIKENQQ